jgi:hypothetical protein
VHDYASATDRGGYGHQASQYASRHTQREVSHGLNVDNKKPTYQLHIQAPDRGRSILDAPYAYEANSRRTPSPEPKAFEYDDVTPEKIDKSAPWHRPTPMSPKNRLVLGFLPKAKKEMNM